MSFSAFNDAPTLHTQITTTHLTTTSSSSSRDVNDEPEMDLDPETDALLMEDATSPISPTAAVVEDDAGDGGGNNNALTAQTLNADGTPKRPMNAFMIFARRRRPQVSAANSAMRTGEISKLLSQEWTSMPRADKQFYLDQAKKLKDAFNARYPDYVYRRRPNNSRKRRRSSVASDVSSAAGTSSAGGHTSATTATASGSAGGGAGAQDSSSGHEDDERQFSPLESPVEPYAPYATASTSSMGLSIPLARPRIAPPMDFPSSPSTASPALTDPGPYAHLGADEWVRTSSASQGWPLPLSSAPTNADFYRAAMNLHPSGAGSATSTSVSAQAPSAYYTSSSPYYPDPNRLPATPRDGFYTPPNSAGMYGPPHALHGVHSEQVRSPYYWDAASAAAAAAASSGVKQEERTH